jgi:hypothetical protein
MADGSPTHVSWIRSHLMKLRALIVNSFHKVMKWTYNGEGVGVRIYHVWNYETDFR